METGASFFRRERSERREEVRPGFHRGAGSVNLLFSEFNIGTEPCRSKACASDPIAVSESTILLVPRLWSVWAKSRLTRSCARKGVASPPHYEPPTIPGRFKFWNLYPGSFTVREASPALAQYQHFYNHVRPQLCTGLDDPHGVPYAIQVSRTSTVPYVMNRPAIPASLQG